MLRLCFLLLLLLSALYAVAAPEPAARDELPSVFGAELSAEQRQTLDRQQSELDTLQETLNNNLADLRAGKPLADTALEQAELNAQTSRLQLENLKLEQAGIAHEVAERSQAIADFEINLKALQEKAASGEQSPEHEARLREAQNSLGEAAAQRARSGQNLTYLGLRLEQARKKLELQENWLRELRLTRGSQRDETQEKQLNALYEKYQAQAAELSRQLQSLPDSDSSQAVWERHVLAIKVQQAEEQALIALRELKLQQSGNQLAQIEHKAAGAPDDPQAEVAHYAPLANQVERLAGELAQAGQLLRNKLELISQQREITGKQAQNLPKAALPYTQEEEKILASLGEALQTQARQVDTLAARAAALGQQLRGLHQESGRRLLLARRDLPLTPEGWQPLLEELFNLPLAVWRALDHAGQGAWQAFSSLSLERWLMALLVSALWLGLMRRLRGICRLPDSPLDEHNFSHHSLLILRHLLCANRFGLSLAGLAAWWLWVAGLPPETRQVVGFCGALWFGIKLPLGLAYALLAAPYVPQAYYSLTLYRQLRVLLLALGLFTGFTVVAHWLPFSAALRDLNDSLFMLFLSFSTFPSLHLRNLILARLDYYVRASYWAFLIRLFSLLLPLALLIVGLLGVLGYVNLGWRVAWHLSLFLLILSGWLIARGLLADLVVFSKNYALQHSRQYGLLWTQDLIPLLHKLARLLLALYALYLLLVVNGWRTDSEWLVALLGYVLFRFGESSITLAGLLLAGLVLASVIWLGRWSRQITYRWIYAGINDLGVRHSLSVFTQYSVLLVGLVITLQVMGIDLTTFTVFAGALGVGLGFGLKDIANNFVSGLLLLAERPLRTGDTVEIGSNGGKVSRIGIRSLTVTTWDNQELIIPNAEVIANPFVNWTLSDNLIRTVFYLGADYDSDPLQVEKLIEGVLEKHPSILREPAFDVYFWEYAESSINFRVQYYTNLRDADRYRVKSEVLHTIWRVFKENGIEIPYPQRDVHVTIEDGRNPPGKS